MVKSLKSINLRTGFMSTKVLLKTTKFKIDI